MNFDSFRLYFQQLISVFQLIKLSVKHKKDFLIVETYSFNEASKVGEFTFTPKIFFALGAFLTFVVVTVTVAVIQFTPLGYALLSHQKHPMEEQFMDIAQRILVLSDSLEVSNQQLEQFKSVIRGTEDYQLAYKNGVVYDQEFTYPESDVYLAGVDQLEAEFYSALNEDIEPISTNHAFVTENTPLRSNSQDVGISSLTRLSSNTQIKHQIPFKFDTKTRK